MSAANSFAGRGCSLSDRESRQRVLFCLGFCLCLTANGRSLFSFRPPEVEIFVLEHASYEEIFHRGTHSVYDSA